MNELSLLKRLPPEHYTDWNGKLIQVGKLIEIIEKKQKEDPDIDEGYNLRHFYNKKRDK
jgi:hypothetical protein